MSGEAVESELERRAYEAVDNLYDMGYSCRVVDVEDGAAKISIKVWDDMAADSVSRDGLKVTDHEEYYSDLWSSGINMVYVEVPEGDE